MDESVTIQGHRVRFATVDLTLPGAKLREALLRLITEPWPIGDDSVNVDPSGDNGEPDGIDGSRPP